MNIVTYSSFSLCYFARDDNLIQRLKSDCKYILNGSNTCIYKIRCVANRLCGYITKMGKFIADLHTKQRSQRRPVTKRLQRQVPVRLSHPKLPIVPSVLHVHAKKEIWANHCLLVHSRYQYVMIAQLCGTYTALYANYLLITHHPSLTQPTPDIHPMLVSGLHSFGLPFCHNLRYII